jgi:hypothetical protein
MSDNPVEVYRTFDPETVAAYMEKVRAHDEWDRTCREFSSMHTGSTNFFTSQFLGSLRMVGLPCRGDGGPEGWRHDRTVKEMLVPDKRTKLGKQYARDMDAIRVAPNVRDSLTGMPVTVHGRSLVPGTNRIYTSGVRLIADETGVECTWDCAVPPDQLDASIWQRVPLSQFHAEMEV